MCLSLLRAYLASLVGAALIANVLLAHEGHHADSRAFGGIMPQLSPDGETIVFSYQGAIWKMPRGGGVMTRLTKGEGFDIEPAWSPDGKRIAFINSRGFSAGTLTVINANGEKIPLPKDITVMDKLHFDPTGERIFGVFQPPNEKVRLAWFDLASGELQPAVDEKNWPGHPFGTPGVMRQPPPRPGGWPRRAAPRPAVGRRSAAPRS